MHVRFSPIKVAKFLMHNIYRDALYSIAFHLIYSAALIKPRCECVQLDMRENIFLYCVHHHYPKSDCGPPGTTTTGEDSHASRISSDYVG